MKYKGTENSVITGRIHVSGPDGCVLPSAGSHYCATLREIPERQIPLSLQDYMEDPPKVECPGGKRYWPLDS